MYGKIQIHHLCKRKIFLMCVCLQVTGADPEIFKRGGGGGVEGHNFERKMFLDTRINACIHKN